MTSIPQGEVIDSDVYEVTCYHCGRKGVGVRYKYKSETMEKSWSYAYNGKDGKFKRIYKGVWLCGECNEFRCKKCEALLSNKFKCNNKWCDKVHGAYSEESLPYCLNCYDSRNRHVNRGFGVFHS